MNRIAVLLSFGLALGVASAQRVEEDNQAIAFNGAWSRQTEAQASGGAHTVGTTVGGTITFSFTGDSLVIYRRLDTDGGVMTVKVDGKDVGTCDFRFTERRWQIPAVYDYLGAGPHTAVLTMVQSEPAGGKAYFDAFEAPRPASLNPTAQQQAALVHVNKFRADVGVPAARLVTAVNLGAQGHAEYNAKNGVLGHDEKAGLPGFIGAHFSTRLNYFGYQGHSEVANVRGPDDVEGGIDVWLETPYHRGPFMNYRYTDAGFGASSGTRSSQVMNFGAYGSYPASRQLTVYPTDGQKDVRLSWDGNESPDPAPGKPRPLGYTISLMVAQPERPTTGTDTVANTATLTDDAGQAVPFYFLEPKTDSNSSPDFFNIVPAGALKPSTTYRVRIAGTDSEGNRFDKAWSFTTLPAAAIGSVYASEQGDSWVMQWSTMGPVVSTKVEYGLTTSYGMTSVPAGSDPTSFVVRLPGLPGGTYHYRITATDAAGNTRSTADKTFVARSIPNSQTKLDFVSRGATSTTIIYSTFGPVPSTVVRYGRTTAYGATESGRLQDAANPKGWYANLTGLTPGTLYHFQIVSTDAQGVLFTMPDATFTTTGTAPANPPATGTAAFLKVDNTTSGSWKVAYGADGYQVAGDTAKLPAYVTVAQWNQQFWAWEPTSSDPRAAQLGASTGRIFSCWYGFGTFTMDLGFRDTAVHQVALYMADYEGPGGGRMQKVEILDAAGTVLDSRDVAGFLKGQYLVWNLSGKVSIRVTNTNPNANAVVSGIFFGTGAATAAGTAEFVKADATTAGSWKGVYGAAGYQVVGDSAKLPTFATVTPAGHETHVWDGATTDTRALLKGDSDERIASCWYSSRTYTVDISFNDVQKHQVALYMLDWDTYNGGRTQTVEVLDTAGRVLDTRTVTDFSAGRYLVWNLSGQVVLRITNTSIASSNAVVAGLFFD